MKTTKLRTQKGLLGAMLPLLLLSMSVLPQPPAAEQARAEKAWNALVTEKGGRAKLHTVTNMVIERYGGDWIQLCVFPDLEWEAFGPFFHNRFSDLFDRRQGLMVKATQDGELETRSNYPWDWTLRGQLAFLLETKWDKPSIVRVDRRKEGKQTFDIIETNIGHLKVEFGYEPDEMLVRRVYLYEKSGLFRIWALDGYRSIDGIQMPSRIAELSAKDFLKNSTFDFEPISFQFNVDYDPKIFERPLRTTTTDAWKKKKN